MWRVEERSVCLVVETKIGSGWDFKKREEESSIMLLRLKATLRIEKRLKIRNCACLKSSATSRSTFFLARLKVTSSVLMYKRKIILYISLDSRGKVQD